MIAPAWTVDGQRKYHYSAKEHAAVLFSLRDAMQRFSIDTDRVFLSGHSLGGDAAWDMALAHPDLWAGAIPIGGTAVYGGKNAPKYVSLYWKNARHVPLYFVGGAKDGRRLTLNSRDLNRYLKKTRINAMVIEYLGRGHENFYDEVQQIFEWMQLHRRNVPTEFEVVTLRPWDRFFWWAEADGFPTRSITMPEAWPPKGTPRPAAISGVIRQRKQVQLTTASTKAMISLSPDHVDFGEDVTIHVNGKMRQRGVEANTTVILEDARRRGDRQHLIWAESEFGTGRRAR